MCGPGPVAEPQVCIAGGRSPEGTAELPPRPSSVAAAAVGTTGAGGGGRPRGHSLPEMVTDAVVFKKVLEQSKCPFLRTDNSRS